MSMSEDSKQKAWLEHYQRLLNIEFDWDPDHLSYQSPVEGPPIPITIDMVKKAISQMKAGKAPGPSGIVVEMIRAAGDMGASMIRDLAVAIIRVGKVPSDWEQSFFLFFFFFIWVLRPFQEYFTYIELIVHRRWAKTGEPGEKPPDQP